MSLPRYISALAVMVAAPVDAQTAADAYYDPEAMAEARASLYAGHGDQTNFLAMLDRLEWQDTEDGSLGAWDLQGWMGGDIDRFWIKSEGESKAGVLEEAELQLLYGKAVSPFFDLQVGVRHELKPDGISHAVFALQGLAPQWFEADLSGFLSEDGDLTARLELEYDALLTQRLVLQPRLEAEFSAQDIPELEASAGLTKSSIGVRLRYEIIRVFAPYIGIEWQRSYGATADAARLNGMSADQTTFVAGVRIWY